MPHNCTPPVILVVDDAPENHRVQTWHSLNKQHYDD